MVWVFFSFDIDWEVNVVFFELIIEDFDFFRYFKFIFKLNFVGLLGLDICIIYFLVKGKLINICFLIRGEFFCVVMINFCCCNNLVFGVNI